MKNSKKKYFANPMKLSVWCFALFLLITAVQFVVNTSIPKVGDFCFYSLEISFVLQILLGSLSVIAFIISCIKKKSFSLGLTAIIFIMLACVVGEGFLGMPYINDFKDGSVTVVTSDYTVIGKNENKSIFFADNEYNEEALRLNSDMLSFLENNNAIDIDDTYVSGTSYLHHISYITIEYYPNTGVLKGISVLEQ